MTSRVPLRSYLGKSAMSWREGGDSAAPVSYIQLLIPLYDELKHRLLSSNARRYDTIPNFWVFLSAIEKKKMPSFIHRLCISYEQGRLTRAYVFGRVCTSFLNRLSQVWRIPYVKSDSSFRIYWHSSNLSSAMQFLVQLSRLANSRHSRMEKRAFTALNPSGYSQLTRLSGNLSRLKTGI